MKNSSSSSAHSPFSGCAILITGVLVVVFLIAFSAFSLFRQYNEIVKFTSEKPALVAISPTENQDVLLNDLAENLEGFRQQLTGKDEQKAKSIELTPEEINLAIAAYPQLKSLCGTFRVLSIEGDTMHIAISFPLNGKPRLAKNATEREQGLISSDPRFLNATLIARPCLLEREIALEIVDILVPGAKVPPEFIEQMSPYRITERYRSDAVLGPLLGKLTRVNLSNGKLVLSRVIGDTAPGDISKKQYHAARNRLFLFLGIGASVFLFLVSIILLYSSRKKVVKSEEEEAFEENE